MAVGRKSFNKFDDILSKLHACLVTYIKYAPRLALVFSRLIKFIERFDETCSADLLKDLWSPRFQNLLRNPAYEVLTTVSRRYPSPLGKFPCITHPCATALHCYKTV